MSPRAKEFDPDDVLNRAMELFWEKGYEATSIKNLVDHMGINRFSLYSTFGDKHQLFLSACDRYRQQMEVDGLTQLDASETGLPSLREYFDRLIERYASERGNRGCMMTNSAVELAPHDASSAEQTGAFLLRQQEAIYRGLLRAHQLGELKPYVNLNDAARFLTNTAQGLAVLSKVSPKREILDAVVQVSLSALEV